MSAIAGAFCPSQLVAANICPRARLAATTAGCTVAMTAASNAAAVAVACPAAASAWPAAAESQFTYWVATPIIAAAAAPCQDPLARSDATEKNDEADEARSSASASQAAAAASSGAEPGPARSSAELISGGNHAKCGFVTNP